MKRRFDVGLHIQILVFVILHLLILLSKGQQKYLEQVGSSH